MRRRELLAGAVALASSPLRADSAKRLAIITPGAMSPTMHDIFMSALRERGFEENANLRVDRLFAQGSAERVKEMVAQVVALRPDVVFAVSGRTVQPLAAATTTIPVVGFTSDPLAYGFVESLSNPRGNITGTVADAGPGVWSKRVGLLKEIAPQAHVVFHLAPSTAWGSAVGDAIRLAADAAGLTLVGPAVDSPFDAAALTRAFDSAVASGAEAVLVSTSPESFLLRTVIAQLAQERRLAAMYPFRAYVEAGGLVAYDVNQPELLRHAASQVADVLRGKPVGSIPFYQSTTFHLVLNLKTATALGLTIPPTLLARADEVIE